MNLLAIDPGPTQSAVVTLDAETQRVVSAAILPNDDIRRWLVGSMCSGDSVAIEMVASYGMPVGAEVFQTCVWIGRLAERVGFMYGVGCRFITRAQVKMHLCHQTKGVNDSVLRQALIDRYGPGKAVAIGCKRTPGPLYGLKADMWQALALGVTALETEPAHV